jgi:hypothetical protein
MRLDLQRKSNQPAPDDSARATSPAAAATPVISRVFQVIRILSVKFEVLLSDQAYWISATIVKFVK